MWSKTVFRTSLSVDRSCRRKMSGDGLFGTRITCKKRQRTIDWPGGLPGDLRVFVRAAMAVTVAEVFDCLVYVDGTTARANWALARANGSRINV